MMTEEEYMKNRVEDQISWYGKKSSKNKQIFMVFSIVIILSGALIPFLSAYIDKFLYVKIIVGILGVIISVLSAMMSLLKLQENWLDYRTTTESLKHEKYLFETKTPPYGKGGTGFDLFVKNIETLISRENSSWISRQKRSDKKHE